MEFLLKALMLFEVIQIYWKLIVKQFQPLRVVPNFNDERVECIAVNGKGFLTILVAISKRKYTKTCIA